MTMKTLGIDYGKQKVGLAISDEAGKISLPFSVIEGKNSISKIADICKKEGIKQIVIGLPKTMRGEEGQQAEEVKKFASLLEKFTDLGVILEDERLTSSMASRFLEKNKGDDDKVAAQIILQGYLDRK